MRWSVRFPLIVGPVLLLVALRQDAAFAAPMATATLLGVAALSGFVLAYGRVTSRPLRCELRI